MSYSFKPGEVALKIKATPSIAKTISILRKYKSASISEIKSLIDSDSYVLSFPYISHSGVRKIRKCYDELKKAGNDVEIYEHDELTTREFISNLIQSHRETDKEVEAQVDEEVRADETN